MTSRKAELPWPIDFGTKHCHLASGNSYISRKIKLIIGVNQKIKTLRLIKFFYSN